jgi:hypothetical protein
MNTKTLALIVLLVTLQASCATRTNGKGTPIPPLKPAYNFEKGISQVPEGYYVFIELTGYTNYSSACNKAPAPVRVLYDITAEGDLWTDLFNLPEALASPIVGFLGYGDFQNELQVIDSLPYTVRPYGEATVYSVDDQGVATIEIQGKTYFFEPGQSWSMRGAQSEPPLGCRVTYGSRLTNYGLLPRSRIHFGSAYSHQ